MHWSTPLKQEWLIHFKNQESARSPLVIPASYFAGRSKRLLGEMAATLLERPSIPAYLYPRIQEDLETLAEFFRLHCARNRRLCRHFGRDGSLIAQHEIDDWSVAYRHAEPPENAEKSLL